MSPRTALAAVRAGLEPLADPRRAIQMRAYLRDQFQFLGIPAPARRAALTSLPGLPEDAEGVLALAALLWRQAQREYRYVAIDLLARHATQLTLKHLPRLEALVLQQPWWETVDGLAGVVGDLVAQARRSQPNAQRAMDQALRHESFWMRRIAMLHQLGWRKDTDEARLFAYAEALAPEREFFIRKAIGWALRDYARSQPQAVRRFLAARRKELSPLTRREAAKHLT